VIRITRFVVLFAAALLARAQDFKALEQKTTAFSLPNGLRFLVVERHEAPVISFLTHVAAGTANDPAGATGIAFFFERLARKGTESIGTRDFAAEKKALDSLEEARDRLDAERAKGRLADEVQIVRLELEVQRAVALAQSYYVHDQFQHVLEENGASAIAVAVSADATHLHTALPSNRAELWFLLESQRLSRPVFRDFYRDRDAAVAEYRARLDASPQLKLLQALGAAAFSAHPYRNPPFGWPGDFSELRQSDARQFFNRHYAPSNIVIAIAGDIQPDEARRLADKYFAPIAARPLPPLVRPQEPPQTGPRTVLLENSVENLLAIGFKRPDSFDYEDPVLDVVQAILADGRSSWLWKELVERQRLATGVRALSSWPGSKSPHLFAIVVNPSDGRTAEEAEKAVTAVLTRLQTEPVDDLTLARGKNRARAAFARRLTDNANIAATLALFASQHGDWRKLMSAANAFHKVTAAHVQTAALKYFIPARRTSVQMIQPAPVRMDPAKGAAR
jgi:predicted Zn-dependent peptidase